MKRTLNLAVGLALFSYSFLMFLALIFQWEIPLFFTIIFLTFIPGYTIAEACSLGKSNLEKLSASTGLSLAIFLGIHGLIQEAGCKSN